MRGSSGPVHTYLDILLLENVHFRPFTRKWEASVLKNLNVWTEN